MQAKVLSLKCENKILKSHIKTNLLFTFFFISVNIKHFTATFNKWYVHILMYINIYIYKFNKKNLQYINTLHNVLHHEKCTI